MWMNITLWRAHNHKVDKNGERLVIVVSVCVCQSSNGSDSGRRARLCGRTTDNDSKYTHYTHSLTHTHYKSNQNVVCK